MNTVLMMTAWALRPLMEFRRLREPARMTAERVMQRLETRKFQGTPPKTRTRARMGRLRARRVSSWRSLLKSLPRKIWRLVRGVVLRTPWVRW